MKRTMLHVPASRPRANGHRFYLTVSLLMLALVTYGFSRTIGPSLLHKPRPLHDFILLSIHGIVFYAWMLFMVVQAALVRFRSIRMHRLLGWFGAADAVLVFAMGIWATFHLSALIALDMVGVISMLGFGIPVALAIYWRKRPAWHRRLLLVATAMLTNAGFARLPGGYLPSHLFYLGADLFLVIGIAHDLWKDRSIHIVYRYALPLFLIAETAVLIPAWRYLS
jgi:hypothetical protein